MQPLNLLSFPLQGSQLIEASAGTGKTFTIAALYLRLVLGHGRAGPLLPPDILVVTFTDAATRELTERIAHRLSDAARFFREQLPNADAFLHTLRAEFPKAQWPLCAYRLELAIQYLDEAAISTIHAWCNRVLAEFALSTGQLQALQLVTDTEPLQQQVSRDYWRSFYYGLKAQELAQVLQYWQTPQELLRAILPIWPHLNHFEPSEEPAKSLPKAIKQRLDALRALKAPWSKWLPEIEALLLSDIAAKKVDGRKLQERYVRSWLLKLKEWAEDEAQELLELQTGFSRLTPDGLAEAYKESAPSHPAFVAIAKLPEQLSALPSPKRALLLHGASWFCSRFNQELCRRSELGFDALLSRVQEVLRTDEQGLAEKLRRRYPVALIDEFQDTDPVQYQLFDAIYQLKANQAESAIVLIGDPKQAIYAFRGADIYSYLQAKQATWGRHYQLMVNYRSSCELIDALNFVFQSAETKPLGTFVLEEKELLNYQEVQAAGRAEQFVYQGQSPAALSLCFQTSTTSKPLSKSRYLEVMAEASAEQIAQFLTASQSGECGFLHQETKALRALQSQDIAVLCNNQTEARAMKQALRRRGLPAVYLSDKGTVFESPIAADVLLWLQASAEPTRESFIRSALGSWSVQRPYQVLAGLLDDELSAEQLSEQFNAYHQLWQRQGVLVMLWQFMRDFQVAEFLQQQLDGERLLTDLLHLAELLQQKSAKLEGMAGLVRYVAEQMAARGAQRAEEQKLRLESDEQLIRIVTIHKSKGLEYPLVFLPFIAASRELNTHHGPISFHPSPSELVVRLDPSETELALAEKERLAEEMRKLYVALTRAKDYCWLGLASQSEASAIGYLVSDEARLHPEELETQFSAWLLKDSIAKVPLLQSVTYVQELTKGAEQKGYLTMSRPVKELWWVASYSALLHPEHEQSKASELHHELTSENQQVLALEASPEAPSLESESNADGQLMVATPLSLSQTFIKGSKAGSFLHDALEWAAEQGFHQVQAAPESWLEPMATLAKRYQLLKPSPKTEPLKTAVTALDVSLFDEQDRVLWLSPWSELPQTDIDLMRPVGDWLVSLLQAPAFAGEALCQFKSEQYKAELEFYLPVKNASAKALDELIRQYLWPELMRPKLSDVQLGGMLKGFIDLTICQDGRYQVLDYKSNFVESGLYQTQSLVPQFLAHRYDVQATLYQVALHRLLKSRVVNYHAQQHLGPALYWFLRGVEQVGFGVLSVDIPKELVLKAEALLCGCALEGV